MDMQIESKEMLTLAQVPQHLPGRAAPWLTLARQAALGRFMAQGFPTRRDEEWKYTDVTAIAKRKSLAPNDIPPLPSSESTLFARTLAQEDYYLMVFVDGYFNRVLSVLDNLPRGASLACLADELNTANDFPHAFLDQAKETSAFVALNTALMTDGAVLRLEPGVVLDRPVYLLFIAGGQNTAIYPRNIIQLGQGAHATVVEHYFGRLDATNFTDVVTKIDLAVGADLEHCKLQQEGAAALHIAAICADQAAHSRFVSQSFALGAHLARNDISSRLNGSSGLCSFDGLYQLQGRQHSDHHTRIDHYAPSCTSREYYRGILDDESRGVFNGKVEVHPSAMKTDAHQSNATLLLSRQAEVDTKPQLEIFADDVKCTHGATIGQLDDNNLFYLRARGISAESARSLLIYGFANDIISRVHPPEMRARIEQLVLDRLPHGKSIKELL